MIWSTNVKKPRGAKTLYSFDEWLTSSSSLRFKSLSNKAKIENSTDLRLKKPQFFYDIAYPCLLLRCFFFISPGWRTSGIGRLQQRVSQQHIVC